MSELLKKMFYLIIHEQIHLTVIIWYATHNILLIWQFKINGTLFSGVVILTIVFTLIYLALIKQMNERQNCTDIVLGDF